MRVRLFKPSVGKEELESIQDSFKSAWLGLGPKVAEFERQWSQYIGSRESVGVNSCTAALHLALAAYRFPEGKKVLVPALTFASTAMAILYNRLIPVFVDVDEATLGISLKDLDSKYDPDCVAVMPVHFGGHPVPMDELTVWAKSHGLKVIEDCAHTAGGKYKGKSLGTWGDIGCYSFEEKKCMTTGDGGMISFDDHELLNPLRHSRWIGINKDTWVRYEQSEMGSRDTNGWYYEISEMGYKYNMNDLMASIGLVQIQKLDVMNRRREFIIGQYLAAIKDLDFIHPAIPYDLQDSSYWAFIVRVQDRDRFITHMQAQGVSTGVHYMPLPMQPLFMEFAGTTPVADSIWKQLVTLPLFPDLTTEEIEHVKASIRSYNI